MINVLSAIMGQGKTQRAFKQVEDLDLNRKVIYVTPLLSECDRVIDHFSNTGRVFIKPMVADNSGSKMINLLNLLSHKSNIVTTHALFRNLTPEHLKLLEESDYTLVLDEVLTVIESFKNVKGFSYTFEHIKELMSDGFLYLDADKVTLRWDKEKASAEESFYQSLKVVCDRGSLLLIDGKCVLWMMPVELINAFKDILICTYLFEHSLMAGYLKMNKIHYEVSTFGSKPSDFVEFINICDKKALNSVGDRYKALSANAMEKNRGGCVDDLKSKLYSFYNYHHRDVPSDRRLWTCFKGSKSTLSGGGYSRKWLACGTKATNDYSETKILAYTCNIFQQPYIVKYFASRGVSLNEDMYALSEMLQWLYRSQIRNNKPITVYIPSSRMRNLLKAWLEDTYI